MTGRRPEATAVLSVPGHAAARADRAADYVLVTDEQGWHDAVAAGLDPVATHLRFSVTDRRSDAAARLGRLVMPWRWRRTVLNTRIGVVYWRRGAPLAPRLGALLAGSRLVRLTHDPS
ncbi:hypothetical protein [Cellulosimicrobium funkei]|uniref:hypothetical protein n=1 Tax=Cellulosimicrobium funkei TaxID=264251 RepID=UPI0034341FF8